MRGAIFVFVLLVLAPAVLLGFQETAQPAEAPHASAAEAGHADGAHLEGHEPSKSYFGVPGWILKTINMLLFLGVLGYFIGGPVKKAFQQRSDDIRKAAEEARARRAKADQLATDIQTRLTQIQDELKHIAERAQAEGERQKQELIAAAEAEAAKILQAARNEIDSRLKHARRELTEYAGQLATERAESLLREKITEADQQKLFQESVREVGEVRS
ncbi:MAG TPA: F0F1 ATP synthase subunit B [Thermoanaerobaculia bacterium]|nr:F0F1 ATP synthase subunit B [Thermoanaerobaculia bacterium]